MKKIKIASMWNSTVEADLDKLVIINLIKVLSKKEIEFVPLSKCDLVIFGPYESQSILNYVKRRTLNSIKRKVDAIDAYFDEDFDREIAMPKVGDFQILYKDKTTAPAWAIAQQHHLEFWLPHSMDCDCSECMIHDDFPLSLEYDEE